MTGFVLAGENVTMEAAGKSLGQNQQEQTRLCVFSCGSDTHILRKSSTGQNRQSVLIFVSSRAVSLVISRWKTQMSARSGFLSPCLFVFLVCCEQCSMTQQRELQHFTLQGDVPSSTAAQGGVVEELWRSSGEKDPSLWLSFYSL